MTTTHQYRTAGNFSVRLTVTDGRGATAQITKNVAITAPTPPTAAFVTSPANPGVDQDVFFNASQSRPAAGRTITSYDWNFGDGTTGTGMLTAHRFTAPGSYQVQLTTTDDVGTPSTPTTVALQVGPVVTATPTATLTVTGSPKASTGVPANFNASGSRPGSGATITSYTFDWGNGEPVAVVTNPIQSYRYTTAGTFVASVTVTDSLGRTATAQVTVTVAP